MFCPFAFVLLSLYAFFNANPFCVGLTNIMYPHLNSIKKISWYDILQLFDALYYFVTHVHIYIKIVRYRHLSFIALRCVLLKQLIQRQRVVFSINLIWSCEQHRFSLIVCLFILLLWECIMRHRVCSVCCSDAYLLW